MARTGIRQSTIRYDVPAVGELPRRQSQGRRQRFSRRRFWPVSMKSAAVWPFALTHFTSNDSARAELWRDAWAAQSRAHCASAGQVSNLLARGARFQLIASSLPGLTLAQYKPQSVPAGKCSIDGLERTQPAGRTRLNRHAPPPQAPPRPQLDPTIPHHRTPDVAGLGNTPWRPPRHPARRTRTVLWPGRYLTVYI